jgi:anti-sigma regulatory factor (Ser/Thr protein kinase)
LTRLASFSTAEKRRTCSSISPECPPNRPGWDWVVREFQEDAMPSDEAAPLTQFGEATVACGPEAPFLARRTVSLWLEGRDHPQLHEDAVLLVSELVTNSVRHSGQPAGAPVHIRAAAVDGVVRVEVHDHGHGPVRPRAPNLQQGGFGLHLVNQLAARWGVSYDHGTRVWFELSAHRHAA